MKSDVAGYYNRNTSGFIRFSLATRSTGALHRSLRVESGESASDALTVIHRVLLDILLDAGVVSADERKAPDSLPLVVDLGCGVGATMAWLDGQARIESRGLTLSRKQQEVAVARLGGPGRVSVGSFTDEMSLSRLLDGRSFDAAYMIESFVHTPSVDDLFSACASVAKPGAYLLICDDFPSRRLADARRTSRSSTLHRRLVAEFRRGWHIHAFEPPHIVASVAAKSGWRLVGSRDLTSHVVLDRPRDIIARVGAPLGRLFAGRSAWWENVLGGAALQRLIRRRLVRYQVLLFRHDTDGINKPVGESGAK
jgi:SAM-dependent methyltransferase